MHHLLGLAFVAFVLTGCTNYQYVTLQSQLPKNDITQGYFIADDKVKIEFDFRGYDFPVRSYISNISDASVYLDLNSSVFIENERVMANAVESSSITAQGYAVQFDNSSEIYLNGSDSPSSQFIHIPPNSYRVIESMPFAAGYQQVLPHYSDYEKISSERGTLTVKRHPFFGTGSTYGILFRFSQDRNGSNYWDMYAEFNESHIYSSTMAPADFPKFTPDTYVVSQTTRGGGGLFLLVLLGLVFVVL